MEYAARHVTLNTTLWFVNLCECYPANLYNSSQILHHFSWTTLMITAWWWELHFQHSISNSLTLFHFTIHCLYALLSPAVNVKTAALVFHPLPAQPAHLYSTHRQHSEESCSHFPAEVAVYKVLNVFVVSDWYTNEVDHHVVRVITLQISQNSSL